MFPLFLAQTCPVSPFLIMGLPLKKKVNVFIEVLLGLRSVFGRKDIH